MDDGAAALWVYMTAGSVDEARAIGQALVRERLAACVNIVDGMRSLYWWDDAVQEDTEAVLIAKTTRARLDSLVERAKALHSYDCPCIVALPMIGGHQAFLSWIATETSGEPHHIERSRPQ